MILKYCQTMLFNISLILTDLYIKIIFVYENIYITTKLQATHIWCLIINLFLILKGDEYVYKINYWGL